MRHARIVFVFYLLLIARFAASSAAEGGCGPQLVFSFLTPGFEAGCLSFGAATLCSTPSRQNRACWGPRFQSQMIPRRDRMGLDGIRWDECRGKGWVSGDREIG